MIVQSRALCRSSCWPAFLSLRTEPIATAVSSRGTAPRRSRSTKKDERTTTRLTPVLCAASTIAPVESAITDPPPPSVLSNASALASARATSAASVALPATTRRLELRIVSFSGERTSAVTVWPAASACSTTRRPVRPVAPRTRRFIALLRGLEFVKLKLQLANVDKKLKRQLIPERNPGPRTPQQLRWLSHREWSAWLQLLGTITLLPAALDSQLQREAGMSHFEFAVMVVLSRQPGRSLQLKDLAVVANGSLSRLSHVISRLGQQGWVRRTRGIKGRATNAELTNKGYQKVMAAGPVPFPGGRPPRIHLPTPGEGTALEHVSARLNVGLLDGISLGTLVRRTRQRSTRRSS